MSPDHVYQKENIFAQILRGEKPCVPVQETEHSLAIMDAFPQSPGHVLVLPKTEVQNLFDISETDLSQLIITVQKLAFAVKKALKPDGIIITQLNGEEAGQTVFHLHWHIIPRYAKNHMAPHGTDEASQANLLNLAEHIRGAL